MEKYINKKSGFTLIEMMIAMALFSILLTLAYGSFLTMLKTQTQARTLNAIQQEGKISTELFSRIAKEAQTVTITNNTTCDTVTFAFKPPLPNITFRCSSGSFQMDGAKITTSDVSVADFQVTFPVSEADMRLGGSTKIISYPKVLSYSLTLVPSGANNLINDLVFKGMISMRSAI